ncbi:MAG: type II secretion system minor pseudopilin GspJ [Gammaproteobacteria bacterium]|jgi:general secretion pathway protein J|nr:type II secretion system minor pseudopilin GspJ [Gammaproteobacteria bacterium]MBT3724774.1 type II secretion system minor pseudopilin GspJ [Gammaproteobacteria bacterium]MBT4075922.1 type II secretion system minor pseudopilin GspJ [Gammaproteobacteria bacterium]MBT4196584.1 type II secretion system minor pseudopilin GspJ [Gammaproteobacteria bacterium]MBT4449316.1 type II secretion system minor pseudopilin GspJ [Gammaproteobacteria bacterium]
MKNFKGFTLFEVLVAVSIFAVIGAMTMSSLIQVGRTGEQVTESQRQLSEVQFALGYMGKDVIQMVNRKIRDQYGDEQSQLIIDEGRLTFTRQGWNNLLQQPRSNLQRVEYALVDDVLQRRYWPQLDQSYSEVKIEQVLLKGVEEFSVKLLTKGKEEIESWPQGDQDSSELKPVALELNLELVKFGKVQRVYEISGNLL